VTEAPDSILVKNCQAGEYESFNVLAERYHSRLYGVALRMVGNHQDACDVTQEVLLKAFENVGRFRERATFRTWLYRIAFNECITLLRKRKKTREHVSELSRRDNPGTGGGAREGPSPSQAAQVHELQEQVRSAVDELEESFRAVVILRDLEGLGYREIACVMQCSQGTVKSRLHRARLSLRDKLRGILNEV